MRLIGIITPHAVDLIADSDTTSSKQEMQAAMEVHDYKSARDDLRC
jgi:hypothetical protein